MRTTLERGIGRGEVAKRSIILDPELGPLTHDRLTRDVRVFQRAKGHRFSSDDVITAYVAVQEAKTASRVLDLGCGLGSVLLHLAWSLPDSSLVGVEAQEVSFELLKRNLDHSGYSSRVRIVHGDLRNPSTVDKLGSHFDLVTGTPPYFPPNSALDAEDTQRALARVEYRGGVEAYVDSASVLVTNGGTIVICADARARERVDRSAAKCKLSIHQRLDVIPKAGRPPLFSVWTLRFARVASATVSQLVLRDELGAPTEDAQKLRTFSGF